MTRRPSIALLMQLAARHTEDRVLDALAAAGFDDLTRAQGRLLAGIDTDGTRLAVLADRARVAKQTAVALVDRLESSGYVERVADPSDGRARLVRLTARGRSLMPIALDVEAHTEREWAARLGTRRMRSLRDALEALRPLVDPAS